MHIWNAMLRDKSQKKKTYVMTGLITSVLMMINGYVEYRK